MIETGSGSSRQADEAGKIEVTPEMIEAGIQEAREHQLGKPIRELVVSVYIAMALEARKAREPRQ